MAFSSMVAKSCDPLHPVLQSHMLNQGKTEYRKWRRCWQLEVSPAIKCRKGRNWEGVNGAQALGIFKLSATSSRVSRIPQFQQNVASYENKPFCDSLNRFDTEFPFMFCTEPDRQEGGTLAWAPAEAERLTPLFSRTERDWNFYILRIVCNLSCPNMNHIQCSAKLLFVTAGMVSHFQSSP